MLYNLLINFRFLLDDLVLSVEKCEKQRFFLLCFLFVIPYFFLGFNWAWIDDQIIDFSINGNLAYQFKNIDLIGSGFHFYLRHLLIYLYKVFPSIGWLGILSFFLQLISSAVILEYSVQKKNILFAVLVYVVLVKNIYYFTFTNLSISSTIAGTIFLIQGDNNKVKFINVLFGFVFIIVGLQTRYLGGLYIFFFILTYLIASSYNRKKIIVFISVFLIGIFQHNVCLENSKNAERENISKIDYYLGLNYNLNLETKPMENLNDTLIQESMDFWFVADYIFHTPANFKSRFKEIDFVILDVHRFNKQIKRFLTMASEHSRYNLQYYYMDDLIFIVLLIVIAILISIKVKKYNLIFFNIVFVLGLISGIYFVYMPYRLFSQLISFYVIFNFILLLRINFKGALIDNLVKIVLIVLLVDIAFFKFNFDKTKIYQKRLIEQVSSISSENPIFLDIHALSMLHENPFLTIDFKNTFITDSYLFPLELNYKSIHFPTNSYFENFSRNFQKTGHIYYISSPYTINQRARYWKKRYLGQGSIVIENISKFQDYSFRERGPENVNIYKLTLTKE